MKPSQPLLARLRLTTKQVNGGYYKGNRTGSMGFFLKSSTYIVDRRKARQYVVPESLSEFKLTPFVTKSFLPTRSEYTTEVVREGRKTYIPRALNGEDYLQLWQQRNPREYQEWDSDWKGKHQMLDAKNKKRQSQLEHYEKVYREKRKGKGGRPPLPQKLRQFRRTPKYGPRKP